MHCIHNVNAGRGQRRYRRRYQIVHAIMVSIFILLLITNTYTTSLPHVETAQYSLDFTLSAYNNVVITIVRIIYEIVVGLHKYKIKCKSESYLQQLHYFGQQIFGPM
jgi:hypothetical protein